MAFFGSLLEQKFSKSIDLTAAANENSTSNKETTRQLVLQFIHQSLDKLINKQLQMWYKNDPDHELWNKLIDFSDPDSLIDLLACLDQFVTEQQRMCHYLGSLSKLSALSRSQQIIRLLESFLDDVLESASESCANNGVELLERSIKNNPDVDRNVDLILDELIKTSSYNISSGSILDDWQRAELIVQLSQDLDSMDGGQFEKFIRHKIPNRGSLSLVEFCAGKLQPSEPIRLVELGHQLKMMTMEAKSGSKYERLRKIGIGSYGVVFKCINRQSGQVVAIKRYSENDSDPIIRKIAMREVRMLRQLKHPNLINLIEVFRRKRKLHLVFDYCELTVLDVIEKYTSNCPLNLIRKIIWQTVNGINYCHTHNCIHRDIKPENILINQSGVVKLCDFGFARSIKSSASPATIASSFSVATCERARRDTLGLSRYDYDRGKNEPPEEDRSPIGKREDDKERQAFTEYVATRWYRAPELLIGEIYYDIKIDIWAIGCVTAELMRGEPIWPGKTDLDQLFTIKSSLGPLTQSQTQTLLSQGIYDQANVERILSQPASCNDSIERKLPIRVGQQGVDFVAACLQMDPARRPTSGELLNHEYIYSARMAQFIQKDYAPPHSRLPLIGDRTVTLPSLSATINRTNSQALMLLTNNQNQHRAAKKFVVGPAESQSHKDPTAHNRKASSIPLAISKPQQSTPQRTRSTMKQVKNGTENARHKPATSKLAVAGAVVTPSKMAADNGGDKQTKRRPLVENREANNSPASHVTGDSRQQVNADESQSKGKSLLPVAKIRSREISLERRRAPMASANFDQDHKVLEDDHLLGVTNGAICVPNEKKPPKLSPASRLVQLQEPMSSSTTDRRQQADANLKLDDGEQPLKGRVDLQFRENRPTGSLKADNKRKTTTNESSASSSNYSDSLGTVRSSSIAFLPPVYQDRWT